MKRLSVLLILLSMIGCAHGRMIVKVQCPQPPILLKVKVEKGTVKGKELDHVIENQSRLWQHIHILEKLGCKAR